MYYIGIDVSKKALSVFDGKTSLEFENKEGLKPFYRYLKKHYKHFDNLILIFEATGIYSDPLREFCNLHQIKAYILNPKQSHNFAKSLGVRSKTDKIDARVIWRYQSLIPHERIQIPVIDPEVKMLTSYLTSYQFIQVQRTAVSNHLESVTDNTLRKLLEKELLRKRQLEEKLLLDIKTYISKHPGLAKDYQRLMTICGIGERLAFSLLALFRHFQGTNRAQITALVGLDPIYKESGTSVKGEIKISKNGNRHIRKMLYLPTLCAIKNNQRIALFYQRLINNHKPKKVAIIAAMRKLLLVAHAIYENKTEYIPG
jgi:transposase